MKITEAHANERKNQILDAAWECFAELGYSQTTMAAIAAAAGLSTGTLYLYFENKDALMLAIHARGQELGRRVILEAQQKSDAPLATLTEVGRAMLASFSEPRFRESTRVEVEMWPEMMRNSELAGDMRRELALWKEVVTDYLTAAQQKGEIRSDVSPRQIALLVIAAWWGLRLYKLVDPEFDAQVLLSALTPIMTEQGRSAVNEIASVTEAADATSR
jgi:AcrR family transcriptional regulator